MLAAFAAFLLLSAFAALGVGLLRRLDVGLAPLETVAFGAPLGGILATLALIPLATVAGLNGAVVSLLGLLCLGLAAAVWPGGPAALLAALQERRATLQTRRAALTAAPTRDAESRSSSPSTPRSGHTAGIVFPSGVWRLGSGVWRLASGVWSPPIAVVRLLPAAVLVLLALRWVLVFRGAMVEDASGLAAGHEFIWSDWSAHVGDVTSFAWGDNFPPENPRLPGKPFAYHFLGSLTAAALVPLGLSPPQALAFGSCFYAVALTLCLFVFARRLVADAGAAALATGLFLFGGGLGWLLTAREIDLTHDPLGTLLDGNPWRYGWMTEGKFNAGIPAMLRLASERAYTFGLPLVLLVLTLLTVAVRAERGGGDRSGAERSDPDRRVANRAFLAAGIAAGLLPLAHLSSLLALALITPVLFLLFPSWGWVRAGVAAGAVALPQLVWLLGGGGGAASSIRMQVGWITAPDPWWWFWLKNLSWFLPLAALALLDGKLLDPVARRVLWAFMPLFALVNLIVFQPWDGDNTKLLYYWLLGASILTAALLARAWRVASGALPRLLIAGIVGSLTLGGGIATVDQLRGQDRYGLLSPEEIALAALVREQTPTGAIFVIGFQGNHAVSMLTGRPVVISFPGWAWAYGIDDPQREQDVRAIYAFAPDTPALLAKYDVSYIVIGPWEREFLSPDEAGLRAAYPVAIATENFVVLDVR